jgi:nucleoside-diphosphate-sugar epimerase
MVLVTGGTGFIGTHLLERLAASGVAVRALVRRGRVSRTLPAGVETVSGDLASGVGVEEAMAGADTVIHLAGATKALRTADYYTGNVEATRRLVRLLPANGTRLVHVSSLAAVGPADDGVPITEDAEPHPLTHYGKSKLEAERLVRDLVPDAVIVRPPVVYGPRDTDVFQLLRSISRGVVIEIAGGPRWFSAIYVKDLVEGLLAAAHSPNANGRTYFLAHAKPVTWEELGSVAAAIMRRTPRTVKIPFAMAYAVGALAEVLAALTGRPGIVSREKVLEARCAAWTCDTSRACRELGFVAPTGLETGMAATLAWYKEAGWLTY